MRSVKELRVDKSSIIRSINENKFNLIVTPRQWGLTTLLINYINQNIPHDKSILFGVVNSHVSRNIQLKITHPNCRVQVIHESGLIAKSFDYIICDNFFYGNWIQKLVLFYPCFNNNGKIILGDTGTGLNNYEKEYFRNFNKIIKKFKING